MTEPVWFHYGRNGRRYRNRCGSRDSQCAKEMGILTVGIVTIPFRFEGLKKIDQALDGVEEISKHVDALLVINNERLREIYPGLLY